MDIEKKLFFNRKELILNNINKTINMEIEKYKMSDANFKKCNMSFGRIVTEEEWNSNKWNDIKFENHDPLSNKKKECLNMNYAVVYGDKFYMVNDKFEIIDEINIYDIKKVEKLENEINEINESLAIIIAILLCIILAIFSKNYLI